MDAITIILCLYWISDILLTLYGWPTTFDWIASPKFLTDLFQYGKCREGAVQSFVVKLIEMPKSWFKHFYCYGGILSLFMVTLTFGWFIFGQDVIGRQALADIFSDRKQVIDEYAVMLICLMMLVQHSRRIYECFFVSVYSKGTMNVIHYLLGILLYSTVQLCAICDGPKLNVRRNIDILEQLRNANLTNIYLYHWNKLLGFLLFIWASYHHNQSHVILANLRKDRHGQRVLHREHIIPRGGLFDYLSAPHFVCEILIYIAMGLVALPSYTFWMGPVLFTFTNQTLMCYETHKWYKKTFKNYPANRRSLIPYVF